MKEEADILSELIADDRLISEGEYTGTISVIEARVSRARKTLFWAIKVGIGKRAVWTFAAAPGMFFNMVMERFKDEMIGMKVKVTVKYREYDEHLYHDGRITEFK